MLVACRPPAHQARIAELRITELRISELRISELRIAELPVTLASCRSQCANFQFGGTSAHLASIAKDGADDAYNCALDQTDSDSKTWIGGWVPSGLPAPG